MKLLELRKKSKLNQHEVAKILNVADSTYRGYESETSEPTINSLCKLADAYSVSLDFLVNHSTANMLDMSNKTNEFKLLVKIIQNFDNAKITMLIGYATRIAQE